MKIGVFSPTTRSGVTTISLLLAYAFKRKLVNNSVTVSQTSPKSRAMLDYLGIERSEDLTRALSQVVQLLRVGAIEAEEIDDYTIKRGSVGILDNATENISEEETNLILGKILKSVTDNVFITDINTEIFEDCTKSVIDNSDFFVMVLNPDLCTLKLLKRWKETDMYKAMEDKGMIFVVNMYNKKIIPLRKFAKAAGIKFNRMVKLDYSPYIPQMANKGRLDILVEYIFNNDKQVISVYSDLLKILTKITRNLGFVIDWR